MSSQLNGCNNNVNLHQNEAMLNLGLSESATILQPVNVNCSELLVYDSVRAVSATTTALSNDSDNQASILGILALLDPDKYPLSYKNAITTRNILIIAFYTSIVFVSLFGNLFVCYVIVKRKRMQTSTNILMANLAVSDLLMTIINIPFNIARTLLNEWPFGPILCVLVPLIQFTSVHGVPVAHFLSKQITQVSIEKFIECLQRYAGDIAADIFMTDMDNTLHNSWCAKMPTPNRRLLCSWHVIRAWKTNIKQKIGVTRKNNKTTNIKANMVNNQLLGMIYTLDREDFQLRLTKLENYLEQQELNCFKNYFLNFYLKTWPPEQWAACYRIGTVVNTNMKIENFHKYVSTLTMTVIAIDRYQAIINPLEKRLSTTVSISIIILFIWVASAIFSSPIVAFNGVVKVLGHKPVLRCRAVYPQPEASYSHFITMFTFLTQYAIPLSITAFAYIRISFYIWHKLSNPVNRRCSTNLSAEKFVNNQNGLNQSPNEYMDQSSTFNLQNDVHTTKHNCYYLNNVNQFHKRSRRKSIKMLAIVVGVFAICWLPLNIYHLNSEFSSRVYDINTFFICHWFAMSSVCYNPFIYFWLNRHYREEIKQIIRCASMYKSSEVPTINNHKQNNHHHHHHHHNPNNNFDSVAIQEQPQRVADPPMYQLTCIKASNKPCNDFNGNDYHKSRSNQTPKSKDNSANCDNGTTKNCKILFRTRFGTTNSATNTNKPTESNNNYVPTTSVSSSNSCHSFRANEKRKLHRSNAVRKIGSNSRSNNASYCSTSS